VTTRTHSTAGTEALDGALTGRLGAGGVRRVVLAPLQHGLADLLGHCLPSDPPPWDVELVRTKFKPGRKLTAYYRVTFSSVTRHVALSWSVQPLTTAVDVSSVEDEARRLHVLAPFTRLAATSDDRRTTLLVGPADPRMPQLVGLSQQEHIATAIAELAGAGSAQAAAVGIATVRYRPGQRHVLRVGQPTGGDGTTFVKLDRDDSGVRAVAVARAVGPILADGCSHAALAQPLGYDLVDHASMWRQAPGAPLQRWLTGGSSCGSGLVGLLGAALRVLHDRGPGPASGAFDAVGGLSAHDAAAELAATLRAGEHLDVLLPELAQRYRALARQVADRLERLPGEAPTFTHGDVKCDNIISDGRTLCLLDLDRCAWADPALDLAKVLADLRWWGASDGADVSVLTSALVVGYGDCDPHRWARARTLAVLFQLKLAARRVTVDDVAWARLVSARVRDAEIALRVEQP
jgi:hypothetical protein